MKKINNLSYKIVTPPFQIKLFGMRTKLFLGLLLLIVAFNANAQKAYIPNTGDNTVSVIDLTSNTVVATIPVGASPYGVSVSKDGSRAYIGNFNDNSISVINTATNTVVAIIPLIDQPYGVCVSPDGSKVYVALNQISNVSIINTISNTVTSTITVGNNPQCLSVSPDNNTLYVSDGLDNSVSVVNTNTKLVVATVPVGGTPTGITVTPDGTKVYVVNQDDNTVSVINTANNSVIATVPVGVNPYSIGIGIDGISVFVPNIDDNAVSVINTATNTVTSTYSTGNYPLGVNVNGDGNKVYTVNLNDNTINVNNISDNSLITTITLGNSPSALGNFLYSPCTVAPGPPVITGPVAVCQLITATYTASSPGGTSYSWTVPSGMTLLSGQGTASISVRIAAGTLNGNVTASASNGCGTSSATEYLVTKKPQAPSSITGPISLCSLSTANYSASSFSATSYLWTLPTGMSISSGTGTSSINVNLLPSFVSGNITSVAVNACGSIAGTTISVFGKVPNMPNTITGPTNVCGLTSAVYTAQTSVGATSYNWIVPSGMLITSGAGTSSIIVSIDGYTNGNISVAGANICGTGTAKTLTLSQASTMPLPISGPATTCGLTSATYSVPVVAGSTGYSWTVPSGATITGQGTNSIIVSFASPLTGNVTVTSTNGCTTSAIRTLAVSKYLPAPGAIAGPVSGLCARDTATFRIASVIGATGYIWSAPSGMIINSGQGTNNIFVNSISTSTGSLKVAAKNACGTSTSTSLAISCSSPMDINTGSEMGSAFLLYPNPVANEFNIDFSNAVNQQVILELYDLLGNKVMSKLVIVENNYSTVKTTIEQLNKGMYFVKLIDINNNVLFTQRVIKQ